MYISYKISYTNYSMQIYSLYIIINIHDYLF